MIDAALPEPDENRPEEAAAPAKPLEPTWEHRVVTIPINVTVRAERLYDEAPVRIDPKIAAGLRPYVADGWQPIEPTYFGWLEQRRAVTLQTRRRFGRELTRCLSVTIRLQRVKQG